MVTNIARYLNSLHSTFNGHVILVTSAPGVRGCGSVSRPNDAPSAAAAGPAPQDAAEEEYWWPKPRYAERAWAVAFQKWAPRLKLSILNITHLSETRADMRPQGDCGHVCYPGLPDHWSELTLRLLEQLIHHH